MSVLDWLFPERVGTKHKANYAFPIGGEYVVDVDCDAGWIFHRHNADHLVCTECLEISRQLTLHI
jgi:hypothetical protein